MHASREHAQREARACRLNPADVLSKWLPTVDRKRHYMFLFGQPIKAREIWRASKGFKTFKPKKIVPAATLKAALMALVFPHIPM